MRAILPPCPKSSIHGNVVILFLVLTIFRHEYVFLQAYHEQTVAVQMMPCEFLVYNTATGQVEIQ